MSREIILRARRLGVCYRRGLGPFARPLYWALKRVSFDLHSGETLGVIGRNGAGKSTLLRILAGIIAPDVGELLVRPGLRRTLLALQAGFMPNLTGRENVVLSGLLLGMARRRIDACMDQITAFSELAEFIDLPIKHYSVGMRARLGFAVALHADADVLLIDEVLGVGDAAFRAKSKAAMRDKIRSDKAVVLASHEPGTLRELCDRLVWIESGQVAMTGPTETVLEAYRATAGPSGPGGRAREVLAPGPAADPPVPVHTHRPY